MNFKAAPELRFVSFIALHFSVTFSYFSYFTYFNFNSHIELY